MPRPPAFKKMYSGYDTESSLSLSLSPPQHGGENIAHEDAYIEKGVKEAQASPAKILSTLL